MNTTFKVGEVCIGCNLIFNTEYNGMECVVLRYLQMRGWHHPETLTKGISPIYEIEWATGEIMFMRAENLRRKQPPADLQAWAQSKVRDLTQPCSTEIA